MALAAVIALAVICWGGYIISIGKDSAGLTAILTPLATLVGVFIYSRESQRRERQRKLPPT